MSIQERIIITKEMEEDRLRRERKIWGVFPRRSKPGAGQPTFKPTPPPSFGPAGQPTSGKPGEAPGEYNEDEGDDGDDIGVARAPSGTSTPTHTSTMSPPAHPLNGLSGSESTNASSTSLNIPKTAGFDFGAISHVLGKNVDPANGGVIAQPDTGPPVAVPASIPPPLDRTGSAPPLERSAPGSRPDFARSQTQAPAVGDEAVSASMPVSPQRSMIELPEDKPTLARQALDASTSTSETQTAGIQKRFVPLPPPNLAGLSLDNEWSTPASSKTAPMASEPSGWGSASASGFGSSSGSGSGVRSSGFSLWSSSAHDASSSNMGDTAGWGIVAASNGPKMAPPARPFPTEYLSSARSGPTPTEEDDDGDIAGFGSSSGGASGRARSGSKTTTSKWDENPW